LSSFLTRVVATIGANSTATQFVQLLKQQQDLFFLQKQLFFGVVVYEELCTISTLAPISILDLLNTDASLYFAALAVLTKCGVSCKMHEFATYVPSIYIIVVARVDVLFGVLHVVKQFFYNLCGA
jgi:hypothetical protein